MLDKTNCLKLLLHNVGYRNRTNDIIPHHKHINTYEHIQSWYHRLNIITFSESALKKNSL